MESCNDHIKNNRLLKVAACGVRRFSFRGQGRVQALVSATRFFQGFNEYFYRVDFELVANSIKQIERKRFLSAQDGGQLAMRYRKFC